MHIEQLLPIAPPLWATFRLWSTPVFLGPLRECANVHFPPPRLIGCVRHPSSIRREHTLVFVELGPQIETPVWWLRLQESPARASSTGPTASFGILPAKHEQLAGPVGHLLEGTMARREERRFRIRCRRPLSHNFVPWSSRVDPYRMCRPVGRPEPHVVETGIRSEPESPRHGDVDETRRPEDWALGIDAVSPNRLSSGDKDRPLVPDAPERSATGLPDRIEPDQRRGLVSRFP